MKTPGRITIDPEVLLGKPEIRGTRIVLDFLLDLLARRPGPGDGRATAAPRRTARLHWCSKNATGQ